MECVMKDNDRSGCEIRLGGRSVRTSMLLVLMLTSLPAVANAPFGPISNFSVIVHDFGDRVFVGLPAPIGNSEGCSNTSSLVLSKNHLLFKEIYAALLSAFHARASISGYVNGCDPYFSVPVLTRIDLNP
jgi:hypothetical protein